MTSTTTAAGQAGQPQPPVAGAAPAGPTAAVAPSQWPGQCLKNNLASDCSARQG